MNIKTIITGLMGLSMTCAAVGQTQPFVIKGKTVKKNEGKFVHVLYRVEGQTQMDSVKVTKGKFEIKGEVKDPTPITVTIDHAGEGRRKLGPKSDSYKLYLDKGEVNLTFKDSIKYANLKGNSLAEEYVKYTAKTKEMDDAIKKIDGKWMAASEEERKNEDFMLKLRAEFEPIGKAKKEAQKEYITENPDSYFSLQALNEISGSIIDLETIEPLYNGLSDNLKQSNAGRSFEKRIEATRKTAVGKLAMDFEQADVDGKMVKLSDFRGKYVLLDFWASWCGPCRSENPNVVEAFHKFKDKNFTVLGVSLDSEAQKKYWLDAIEKDELTWTQLSDLKGWKNEAAQLYGVRAIPQNYLIGPDGTILAINLRGKELHLQLERLLGK